MSETEFTFTNGIHLFAKKASDMQQNGNTFNSALLNTSFQKINITSAVHKTINNNLLVSYLLV